MITVEDSIVIKRPVEEVFAFVADQTKCAAVAAGIVGSAAHHGWPAGCRHQAYGCA